MCDRERNVSGGKSPLRATGTTVEISGVSAREIQGIET